MSGFRPLLSAVCCISLAAWSFAVEAGEFVIAPAAQSVLTNRCMDCHSGKTAEGDVRLDTLAQLDLPARLQLLNRAQDQVFFGLMPPEDAEPLNKRERASLAGWLRRELRKHNASNLDEKLRYPSYGNYVEHERLFSGEIKEKAWSPSRRWLVSPQIFHERVIGVFKLDEADRNARKHRSDLGDCQT